MAVVEVFWIDSNAHGGWQSERSWDEALRTIDLECRSVGYLFRDDAEQIVLLQSASATGSMADAIMIPKCSVIGYKRLRARGTRWKTVEDFRGQAIEGNASGSASEREQEQADGQAVHEAVQEGHVGA